MHIDILKNRMLPLAALCALCAAGHAHAQGAAKTVGQTVPPGFTALFDGYSLNGWRGDERWWSVVDGTITARTDTKLSSNTFLYYDRPYADFELRYKYRWRTPKGNSGVQIRSHVLPGSHAMTGYQVNIVPHLAVRGMADNTPGQVVYNIERFNMLYNEKGDRQEMVLLGQRATISRGAATAGGTGRVIRTVAELVNDPQAIVDAVKNGPEWTEVTVIAYGNRIVSAVNGMLAFDAIDDDPVGKSDGLIGIQLHSTAGTWFELKDIVIKPLIDKPDLAGRFKTSPRPAPEPRVTYKDSTRAGLSDVALPAE
ncbi:MAG: hypothetical protein ABS87_01610 [Sphingomonas sp. SCN 67-18]|uniref:3-keto-disaccharide hydrolase n=1 Tax=uncultured Sphingomonas sp. TaxID=158754 RepID=UPI0008696F51|nr:DUF1080 domain-containing protein [Sphingomonas sp. SCN 67-18]ODU22589.1 MAG: hypothetical protein ABS87_01610 [Sphingomonas sp. SCN 67-18]